MTPLWLRAISANQELTDSLMVWLDDEENKLRKSALESASDWGGILVTRGALAQLADIKRQLTAEEKENAQRKAYDLRAGRNRVVSIGGSKRTNPNGDFPSS